MLTKLLAADVELAGPFQRALKKTALDRAADGTPLGEVKQETIARLMGQTPEQLYQQLHAKGHFPLNKLFSVARDPDGRRFLLAFYPELALEQGIPEIAEALKDADAFSRLVGQVQVRMLKAQLRVRSEAQVA